MPTIRSFQTDTNMAKETPSNAIAIEAAIASAVTAAANAATVQNDITWMKKSLTGIEQTLKDMNSAFVTQSAFQDTANTTTDHEKRLRTIEENMWKWIGIFTILSVALSTTVATIVKNFIG